MGIVSPFGTPAAVPVPRGVRRTGRPRVPV